MTEPETDAAELAAVKAAGAKAAGAIAAGAIAAGATAAGARVVPEVFSASPEKQTVPVPSEFGVKRAINPLPNWGVAATPVTTHVTVGEIVTGSVWVVAPLVR